MKSNLLRLSLFCLLFLNHQLYAQISSGTHERIDQLFKHVEEEAPGYMVAVIKDGEYLFQKGYGLANLEYKIPISTESSFNVASLSKQFTAACIALLILDGKLSLEDNIRKYLPDFPDYGHNIQLKHLIYMTSGINDYYYNPRKNGTDWSSLHFFNIDTAINTALSNNELMYAPGSQWSYSNINYMLLTKVVEKVSQKPFSQFIKERLFNPLGMKHTLVNDDIFQVISGRVDGYNYRTDQNIKDLMESGYLSHPGSGFIQIRRNSPHYGGSGIYTTMDDLKKWIVNFQEKSFGGEAFYNLMHQTMKFEHNKSNDAFGLVFGDFNGHEIIWYEGGTWGFSSYMMRFPKNELTVVVLSNLGEGQSRKYANQLMDILIADKVVNLD